MVFGNLPGIDLIFPVSDDTALALDGVSNVTKAYSLNKLITTYTGNSIRVRRSSDNAEQNFGFVGNTLDTAGILSFCGGSSGFITTWYNQNGSGNNLTQSTTTKQPRIVDAGTIETNDAGNVSVFFDGVDDEMTTGAITAMDTDRYSVIVDAEVSSSASINGTLIRTNYTSGAGAGSSLLSGILWSNTNDYRATHRATDASFIAVNISTVPRNTILFYHLDTDNIIDFENYPTGTTVSSPNTADAVPSGHIATIVGNSAGLVGYYAGHMTSVIWITQALPMATLRSIASNMIK